ncbi:glycosyltransferase family 4 protein [Laspinema olomoucense]|uniref:glycosyltransferase family 4 protein n=1 Tax=Laspinema olomoucense TaxID=3231600 RepID=UPI0021BB4BC6|nr:glycosyltransferase family 4 protein [Laspinema sp. D3c]MCT7995240.1 glycosyltransferase family 4 protein [Laspinema sp. D3c]
MSNCRIAYLCLSSTNEGRGAEYAHVHEIINGLSELGFAVVLFEPKYSIGQQLPTKLERVKTFVEIQYNFFYSQQKFEVLYVRSHFAALPSILWAKIFGITVVQEINGSYEDLFISWPLTRKFSILFKCLMRIQMRFTDAFIAVTPQLQEWILRESSKKLAYVIPNGANTEIFSPQAKTTLNLPECYVVWFGSMAPWQGIETMLAAVEHSEWPRQVSLVLIGEGIEANKVKDAAIKNPKVVYLGRLPYAEVAGVVAKSIGGLIPKNNLGNCRFETGLSPLKLYETLSCGVPAIVTDFPGQADLIRSSKCGIVIAPENPKLLAEAVAFLHDNPGESQEMGESGRQVVNHEHSWKQRAKDTAEVIKILINPHQ